MEYAERHDATLFAHGRAALALKNKLSHAEAGSAARPRPESHPARLTGILIVGRTHVSMWRWNGTCRCRGGVHTATRRVAGFRQWGRPPAAGVTLQRPPV